MATNAYYGAARGLLLIVLSHFALGQTLNVGQTPNPPRRPSPMQRYEARQKLLLLSELEVRQLWLMKCRECVGMREQGFNRHPLIQKMNLWAGVAPQSPYCATGLGWNAYRAGLFLPIPGIASVRSWFATPAYYVYERNRGFRTTPQLMDVVWIFSSHAEGFVGAGRIDDLEEDDFIQTVAFNTRGESRHEGVHYPIFRRWRDVVYVTNHVTPYLAKLRATPVDTTEKARSVRTAKPLPKKKTSRKRTYRRPRDRLR